MAGSTYTTIPVLPATLNMPPWHPNLNAAAAAQLPGHQRGVDANAMSFHAVHIAQAPGGGGEPHPLNASA